MKLKILKKEPEKSSEVENSRESASLGIELNIGEWEKGGLFSLCGGSKEDIMRWIKILSDQLYAYSELIEQVNFTLNAANTMY